jgi:spore coat polysaccharide biosynthesis protein SpsF (cytidylyltransferase family)
MNNPKMVVRESFIKAIVAYQMDVIIKMITEDTPKMDRVDCPQQLTDELCQDAGYTDRTEFVERIGKWLDQC